MKLKARGNQEAVIERFNAQSSKTATFAKSVIKKKEASELNKNNANNVDT